MKRVLVLSIAAISLGAIFVTSSTMARTRPQSTATKGGANDSGGTIAAIKKSGVLNVAGAEYVPFVVQEPSGKFVGIDVETLQALAKSLGVKLNMESAGFDTVIAGLNSHKWDIVPSLCKLPSREKVINFTRTYLDLKSTWYVKSSSKYHTLGQLNNPSVTFVVPTGTEAAIDVPKYFPKAKLKQIPGVSDPQLLQEVLAGRADATQTDWPVTYNVLRVKYANQLRFIPNDPSKMISGGCPVAWGVRKGDPQFLAYLNSFLGRYIASGNYAKLKQKYFSAGEVRKLFP